MSDGGATQPGDLRIAGLVPMSGVDWPGRFVATARMISPPKALPMCHSASSTSVVLESWMPATQKAAA